MVAQGSKTSQRDSYAKLNLNLQVFGRRGDGFHELRTVMVPVTLGDRLRGEARSDGRITLQMLRVPTRQERTQQRSGIGKVESVDQSGHAETRDAGEIPTDHRNLIIAIATEFQQKTGVTAGVDFTLLKRIPAGGGLGGASSNAAAALEILNQIWGTQWPRASLAEFSAGFGSDIPFFFSDSAAVAEGRGEKITPVPMQASDWMVIIRPPFALSTPAVFAELKAGPLNRNGQNPSLRPDTPNTDKQETDAREQETRNPITGLTSKRWVRDSRSFENDLTAPAKRLQPRLETLEHAIRLTNPLGLTMSGSGSCYFAVYRNRKAANIAAMRLRGQQAGQTFVVRPALSNWMVKTRE